MIMQRLKKMRGRLHKKWPLMLLGTASLITLTLSAMVISVDNEGNHVDNFSFEEHGSISHNSFQNFTSIPGWTSPDNIIQLHDGSHGGIFAHSGETKLELDALGNTTVEQAFVTEINQRYDLNLYYTPRITTHGTDTNDIEVWWEDELLATLSGDERGWQQHQYDVQALGDIMSLRLVGAGASDNFGGFIDDVNLSSVPYTSINLVENPSFEDYGNLGNNGYVSTLPGWEIEQGDIRLRRFDRGGLFAKEGIAKLQLYSDTETLLSQDIDTNEDIRYELSFNFSPKTSNGYNWHQDESTLEVWWDDTLLDTLTGDRKAWQRHRYDVTTNNDTTTLSFKAKDEGGGYYWWWYGSADSFLDDVRVYGTCRKSENLIENGSFEEYPYLQFDYLGRFNSITGWVADHGVVEIHIEGLGGNGVEANEGIALLDTDANANATITQTINTQAGETYHLQFDYSPRVEHPGTTTNDVEVWWDGELLATLSGDLQGWQNYRYTVEASSSQIALTFKGVGSSNAFGGLIDDVALYVANNTPSIDSTPITTAAVNTLYTDTVIASDVDGDAITYSLVNFPDGMVIDEDTGVITWTPEIEGTFDVTVQATDTCGEFSTLSYSITVTTGGANTGPVITSTPITDATVGIAYNYDVDATDADNDALDYSLQIAPAGMTIDNLIGVISWTPTSAQVGINAVVILVDDSNGGTTTQSFDVTVIEPDLTAPTITITSPADGVNTNQTSITVTGSLDEDATLNLNGNAVTVNSDLSFTATINLVEGSNSLNFEATDMAGNVGTNSITITLDTTLPVITITSPQDGLVTNQASQTITGTLNEAGTLSLDGNAVNVNPDLSFSVNVTLNEGLNSFAFVATDNAANQGNASIDITLDTVNPVITITNPADGLVTNQATQTVIGNVSKPSTLTLNGNAVTVNPDLSFNTSITLNEGSNSLSFEATDTAGNVTTESINVTLDTVLPVITISGPQDDLLTNIATQTVAGSVSETATVTVNGTPVSLAGLNYSQLITLTQGLNTITVSATDAAGNVGSANINVTLDNILPVITVTSPANNALTNQTTISVTGNISEIATLSINGNGVTVQGDLSFSAIVDLNNEDANAIDLVVTDSAGNVGTVSINVDRDTTPPGIIVTNPIDGSTTNQSAQLITGSLTEGGTITVNGIAGAVNPDNTFLFGPVLLNEGSNSFTIEAIDNAGNVTDVVSSVTLDTIVPEISLTTPETNLLSSNTTVTFTGSVNEAVNLTIFGQTVTQQADLSFTADIALNEGQNVVDVIATDGGGNGDTETLTITIDTTPPATPDTALINRGNPANGIVMVSGQPGSVEANTLVHVINIVNGYEAIVLAQSDGSFSTDVSGFANDNFQIFTVDAAGNQSATANLNPNLPLSLTLDPIGNRVAPIGQVSRFTVTASDSTGEPIALGLTPLPLPDGMEYNIVTGELSFKPNVSQVGDIELTFSAQSDDERVTETITVTVPAVDPTAPTNFTGRVLDATSMQGGTIVPIVGATISYLNTPAVTTTDAQGFFTLTNIPSDAVVFDVDSSTAQPAPDGSPYASFRERLIMDQNVLNLVERPFYMPRIDASSLTTVDPAQNTVVNNPNLGITLTVPANTAINTSDGTPFTGQLSISEVPLEFAPANMPPELSVGLLITIQPVGVEYTTPVPISFTNTESYDPESEFDLMSVDPDAGVFVVVGTNQVSLDGQTLDTISGGIVANDWHLFRGSPSNPIADDPDNPCNCSQQPFSSTVTMSNGHMNKAFNLPAYRSLEESRSWRFMYQTDRAMPQPIIPFRTGRTNRQAFPNTVSAKLKVAGLDIGEEAHFDGADYTRVRGATPAFISISFSAEDFETGIYDYDLTAFNNYDVSRNGRTSNGQIMVQNEINSSFGAGWMLEGLYHLAFHEDGPIMMSSPRGNSIIYRPTAAPDIFSSPTNDFATFVRNPDGTYTHTEKDGVKMHFDAAGLLIEHEDRNNNITAYAYDADDRLETITDPVGLVTTFVYDNNGLLDTVTDPGNRTTTFEHDATGNMTKVTFPDNTFKVFEYDDRHLMTAHEDERQNRYVNRYDNFGRVIDATLPDGTIRTSAGSFQQNLVDLESGIGSTSNPAPLNETPPMSNYVDGRGNDSQKELDVHGRELITIDELGRVTEHVRDADSNPTQTTRPIGSVVTRTFDNFGNVLTQKEEFNGATTTYTYDQFSLVTSIKNPRDNTTTMIRDNRGNVEQIINELGHTTTMVYDSRGLVTKMTSPNGLITDYTYNIEGLMDTKTETPPTGSPGNVRVWSYSYFPTGLLQTVNTPDGITLNYIYDARSDLISVTDNLNQSIEYTYDEYKNVIKTETKNTDGSVALLVDSVYDNRNRLVQTKAPHAGVEESIMQRILDENSNLIGLIDPNGNSSSNSYDVFNRLETNTHRENGVTQYVYDDQDRITLVIAPNNVLTNYEYDIISRRTKEISRDRGTIEYAYDLANNVTSITDGRGITATMTYDELERVSSKTFPNTIAGKNENVAYTYDTCNFGLGFLCERIDESGTTNYNYDAFGNVVGSSFTEIEGAVYSTNYLYDDGDNVIQTTLPSGRVIDYTRDGVRRISAINTVVNGNAKSIVSNIQYRGDNQMTQCTYGNGLVDERNYDQQGRLTDQLLRTSSNTLLDQRVYTYDKNSNVLNIDTNTEDNTYVYDKLDRLINDAIDNNPTHDLSYDLNDNRLSRILDDLSVEELLEYQISSNRLVEWDTFKTGNDVITDIPNRNMVYNDAGRLFQLFEEGGLKAEYIYNDQGQRTRKTKYQTDGVTVDAITIYHYDQMGYLVTETTETGALIKDYIWQEGMHPVAQIDNTLGTEQVLYLTTDHLMTNRLATDDFQTVVWRWEGEAFGNTSAQELAGFTVNLRFPGQYYDEETNLHYNWNRYYDPSIGRYITSDPIGLRGGNNTYGYADQNPVMNIDPDGLLAGKALKCILNPKKCRKNICNRLNKLMHIVCDSAKSCKGGDTCMTLRIKKGHLQACLALRLAVRLCHGRKNDPNPGGHEQQIQQVRNRIKKCDNLLEKDCC